MSNWVVTLSMLTVPIIATCKTLVVVLVDVDVTVVNVVTVEVLEVVVKKVVVAVCATVEVCPTNKARTTNTAHRPPKIDRIIKLTLRYDLQNSRLKRPSMLEPIVVGKQDTRNSLLDHENDLPLMRSSNLEGHILSPRTSKNITPDAPHTPHVSHVSHVRRFMNQRANMMKTEVTDECLTKRGRPFPALIG